MWEKSDDTWDERLHHYGIYTIYWAVGHDTESSSKRRLLEFIFDEMVNDRRMRVGMWLSARQDKSEYLIGVVPQELEDHGVEDVWVTTRTKPNRSMICLKMKDLSEAISITKNY